MAEKPPPKVLPKDDPRVLRIRQAAREGRIQFADDRLVAELRTEVLHVTEVLGHPEALCSDESSVADFALDDVALAQATLRLGVPLDPQDRIVDVALRLRALLRGQHTRS